MDTIRDTLIAVKGKLSSRSSWCQNRSALNKEGRQVDSLSPEGVTWCLGGALENYLQNALKSGKVIVVLNRASKEVYPETKEDFAPYITVNDKLGFEAVHAVLDRAIANEGEKTGV